ncbi:tRNA (adenosine(37)-N6)-threonylcarbamoyltransferase complex dimerization subunit type 1 TsaB [Oribacterium sp. NK2B42]|uniref:tRNA (adenosine(37)-N6)-threonylcarbamoyltransferase complex dimerization subunit type 1 TsaB n=1 Tax=Oribacterium sp. NK2B42 TaxID=689781 RepID=UPI0004011E87|nr:tRNA (adenosine(37)-N6)-threonylcarbamoyltransferase complex dimerization subunit type 1 TsaB [Oribacterium sp. NK2B42]
MLVLGIDSSGHTASCALIEDNLVLSEYSANIGLTHSQTLLPMVAEIFSRTGRSVSDLDAIAVSAGPGSFTGLRIGASTAKGLALGYGIPLIEVSTLEGLAKNVSDMGGISSCTETSGENMTVTAKDALYVHPIMDARRKQVYTGAFLNGTLVGEEEAIGIDELAGNINKTGGRHLFLGDAVPVYREYLMEHLTVAFSFASPQNLLQRASSVALIGMEKLKAGETVSSKDFRLSYIRKPQAEREKEASGLREFDITHDDPNKLKKSSTEDVLAARNYKIGEGSGYEDESIPENL